MGQTLIECPECGAEMLVQQPGTKVAGVYVEIGYSNDGAVIQLHRAIELLEGAVEALPLREDLETALRLLRQVDSQLVTIAEE